MLDLIVNPSAGGGRAGRALDRIRSALDELALEHRLHLTVSLEHARELAQEAAAAGVTAVACGGDGVIAAVAGGVADAGGLLGVIPGGRGNDFARALGIPRDPAGACAVLAGGARTAIDLGEVGSRTFIGIASCGFDSVANRIANEATVIRGNLVYAYGAARAMVGWRAAEFTVTVDDGEPRHFSGYSVAACNAGYYGGGMHLAPEASLSDGELDVVTISDMPRLRYLRLLPTVFSGRHVRLPTVAVQRAHTVRIEADRPFTLYADGDPIAELPATITIRPAAVNVLVPRASAAPDGTAPMWARRNRGEA